MDFYNLISQRWIKIAAMLVVYDIVATNLAYGLALWLRFDLRFSMIPDGYLHAWITSIPVFTIISLAIFVSMKLYRSVWRFVSYNELMRVGIATLLSAVVYAVLTCVFFERLPILFYLGGFMIQFLAMAGIRFSYRAIRIFTGFCRARSDSEPLFCADLHFLS